MRRGWVCVAWVAASVTACGGSDGSFGTGIRTSEAGVDGGGASSPLGLEGGAGDDATGGQPPVGAGPGGGRAACSTAAATCAHGIDCCSGTCTAGLCVGSTLGGAAGGGDGGSASGGVSCGAPSATCSQSSQCCSGLCEPVTGQAGVIQCRDACRADGVACELDLPPP